MNEGRKSLRRIASGTAIIAAMGQVNLSWRRHLREAAPHCLPGRLAVTLTSYPERFGTLALTLKSLLAQSTRPDFLYLWIAKAHIDSLPDEIVRLQADGILIRSCDDLRSYKKIIPALSSNSDDFLVIADDDVFYPRHWLREIVGGYRGDGKEVICGRAHRVVLDERGLPLSYLEWEREVTAGESSRVVFPTGIGGVMYVPGIFHPDVTRTELFRTMCPTADDIWLFWMAALNGARFRKVGPQRNFVTWFRSQDVGLFSINCTSNDLQIANMITRYGFPHP